MTSPADLNQTPPPPATVRHPPSPARQAEPIDCWLRGELHQLHDEILREPIPEALLRLITGTEPGRTGEG